MTRNINDAAAIGFLTTCKPDFLVSAFFNQRVHAAALGLPVYGCVNIHPSLLPEAKGVDPVFQALLHDEPQLGVTVHYMNDGLDDGPIVSQRSLGRPPGASVFATTSLLYGEGAELLASAVESIIRGTAGTAQQGAGSYQSWPTRHELLMLRARGRSLLSISDFARLLFTGTPLR
jgi:methionyl-tRNA formyltransferase